VTHGVSFWDATILVACVEAGVDVLYAEDVPGLDMIGALRVVNPFK
jgi:predicted nucleic acid-binding protein